MTHGMLAAFRAQAVRRTGSPASEAQAGRRALGPLTEAVWRLADGIRRKG